MQENTNNEKPFVHVPTGAVVHAPNRKRALNRLNEARRAGRMTDARYSDLKPLEQFKAYKSKCNADNK